MTSAKGVSSTATARTGGPVASRLGFRVLLLGAAASVHAGEADVIDARVNCTSGSCSVSATVRHEDTGWEHYADHFRVLTEDDQEIARRVLYHPHVEEQPFTRSLGSVRIPPGSRRLWVEAHDSVHGYGGKRIQLPVPGD